MRWWFLSVLGGSGKILHGDGFSWYKFLTRHCLTDLCFHNFKMLEKPPIERSLPMSWNAPLLWFHYFERFWPWTVAEWDIAHKKGKDLGNLCVQALPWYWFLYKRNTVHEHLFCPWWTDTTFFSFLSKTAPVFLTSQDQLWHRASITYVLWLHNVLLWQQSLLKGHHPHEKFLFLPLSPWLWYQWR